MKVTIEGIIFEGSSEEIYEILNKLGYLIKFTQPIKIVEENDLPIKSPYINPYPITPPYWAQPWKIGDPPPGTYPQVWCGTINYEDMLLDDVPKQDDLDKLSE